MPKHGIMWWYWVMILRRQNVDSDTNPAKRRRHHCYASFQPSVCKWFKLEWIAMVVLHTQILYVHCSQTLSTRNYHCNRPDTFPFCRPPCMLCVHPHKYRCALHKLAAGRSSIDEQVVCTKTSTHADLHTICPIVASFSLRWVRRISSYPFIWRAKTKMCTSMCTLCEPHECSSSRSTVSKFHCTLYPYAIHICDMYTSDIAYRYVQNNETIITESYAVLPLCHWCFSVDASASIWWDK